MHLPNVGQKFGRVSHDAAEFPDDDELAFCDAARRGRDGHDIAFSNVVLRHIKDADGGIRQTRIARPPISAICIRHRD